MADSGGGRWSRLATGLAAVIRVDQWWLAAEPVDMRTGADCLLAQVVQTFRVAQRHHAWLFANRLKVLVHDGHGIWLAQRRLHQLGFTGKAVRRHWR